MNRNTRRKAKLANSVKKKAGFKVVNPPSKRRSKWKGCKPNNFIFIKDATAWPKS